MDTRWDGAAGLNVRTHVVHIRHGAISPLGPMIRERSLCAYRRRCRERRWRRQRPDPRNLRPHSAARCIEGAVSALTSGRDLRHWAALRRCHVSAVFKGHGTCRLNRVINIIIVPPSPPPSSSSSSPHRRCTDTSIGMRDSDALEINLEKNGAYLTEPRMNRGGLNSMIPPRQGKLTYLCICSPNCWFERGNERETRNSHKTKRNLPFTFLDSL